MNIRPRVKSLPHLIDANLFFSARQQAFGQLFLQLVTDVNDQAGVHIRPVSLEISIALFRSARRRPEQPRAATLPALNDSFTVNVVLVNPRAGQEVSRAEERFSHIS